MQRLALGIALLLLLAGCGGSKHRSAQLIGLDTYMVGGDEFEGTALVRVRAKTLRPYGRRLLLGDGVTGAGVRSPDGKVLAFGGYNFGEILLVDLARLKQVAKVVVAGSGGRGGVEVRVEAWPRPDRLVAVATAEGAWRRPHPSRLVVVDPVRRRVVRRASLHGGAIASATVGDGTVALLVIPYRKGTPTLAVVRPDGRLHAVRLERLDLGGRDGVRVGGLYFAPSRLPALASDGRRHAFVVAADRPIAEVDLRTLTVRYHRVRLPDVHLSRPPAWEAGSSGPQLFLPRGAQWFGRDLLAVGGYDEYPARLSSGRIGIRMLERPLQLVDTRRWRLVRTLPVSTCRRGPALFLCSATVGGFAPDGKGQRGPSLVAYTPDWKIRYRKRSSTLWWDLVAGRLFAGSADGSSVSELDPRTGRLVRRLGRAPLWPLEVVRARG